MSCSNTMIGGVDEHETATGGGRRGGRAEIGVETRGEVEQSRESRRETRRERGWLGLTVGGRLRRHA